MQSHFTFGDKCKNTNIGRVIKRRPRRRSRRLDSKMLAFIQQTKELLEILIEQNGSRSKPSSSKTTTEPTTIATAITEFLLESDEDEDEPLRHFDERGVVNTTPYDADDEGDAQLITFDTSSITKPRAGKVKWRSGSRSHFRHSSSSWYKKSNSSRSRSRNSNPRARKYR